MNRSLRGESLIESASKSAAVADGVAHDEEMEAKGKKAAVTLRRGKWTAEEEAYANRLISEFKSGLLPLTDGTTLRTFLSKLLNCDPMRISKKFVGGNCIGKQVFRRRQAEMDRLNSEDIDRCRNELADLERHFLERVAQTSKCRSNSVGGSLGLVMSSKPPVTTGVVAEPSIKTPMIGAGAEQDTPVPPWLSQPPRIAAVKQELKAAPAGPSQPQATPAVLPPAVAPQASIPQAQAAVPASVNGNGTTEPINHVLLQHSAPASSLNASSTPFPQAAAAIEKLEALSREPSAAPRVTNGPESIPHRGATQNGQQNGLQATVSPHLSHHHHHGHSLQQSPSMDALELLDLPHVSKDNLMGSVDMAQHFQEKKEEKAARESHGNESMTKVPSWINIHADESGDLLGAHSHGYHGLSGGFMTWNKSAEELSGLADSDLHEGQSYDQWSLSAGTSKQGPPSFHFPNDDASAPENRGIDDHRNDDDHDLPPAKRSKGGTDWAFGADTSDLGLPIED